MSWLIFMGAGVQAVWSMSVVPPSFDELVTESERIVRVEVLQTTPRLENYSAGQVIHTYVHCRMLRVLKGAPEGEEITLRFQGGQVGDLRMVVPGMPEFQPGDRCIFFVARNGEAFCPLIGAGHGSYRIQRDEKTGEEHVLRNNFEPLRDVASVARPLRSKAVGRVKTELVEGLRLAEFEKLIAEKVGGALRDEKSR